MKSNGELKIEKGIPIPAKLGSPRGALRRLLPTMKKGDSVFVAKGYKTVYQTARLAFGAGGYVSIAAEGDGVRVWRIK